MAGTSLAEALSTLRRHEADLRRLGVSRAAVFGSVARSEWRDGSDIDVLVDLDKNRPMGILIWHTVSGGLAPLRAAVAEEPARINRDLQPE
jgi:predicted nucleotidyltransferase